MDEPHEFQATTAPPPAANGDVKSTLLVPMANAPAKQSLAWLWVVLGVIGGLALVTVVGALLLSQAVSNVPSAEYSGEPVAFLNPEAPGLVVSEDGTVAYQVGSTWLDATEYVDLSAIERDLVSGQELLAVYYTQDPFLAGTQVVMVFSYEGGVAPRGELDDYLTEYLQGATAPAESSTIGAISPYSTLLGLEGFEATYQARAEGFDTESHVVVVVRGTHAVVVHIMAYNESVRPGPIYSMLNTLHID